MYVESDLDLGFDIIDSVDDDNLDRIRFRVENHANPTLQHSLNAHFVLAIVAILPPSRYLSCFASCRKGTEGYFADPTRSWG